MASPRWAGRLGDYGGRRGQRSIRQRGRPPPEGVRGVESLMVGRGQVVRHGTLAPAFEGSNPSAPATSGPAIMDVGARTAKEGSRVSHGMAKTELRLFTGSAHPLLAQEIAEFLCVPMGQARLHRFADTEVSFQIDENIRGMDVFIIQPTSRPVDEHLMELCIMMDAFRRSSAARITAVIPYYGYARQDRKDKPRVPISAKLVANLIVAAGADRVLTMDLHKAQIQAFFDIPTDHLFAAPVIIDYLSRQQFGKVTIVSPDAGGAERARAYAKRLGADLAIIDKRRSSETGSAEVMNVIGDIKGRICVLQDDIIDPAGTIVKAAQALHAQGAERIV